MSKMHQHAVSAHLPPVYHRPEWDNDPLYNEIGDDAILKLIWSGIEDRFHAELSNLLEYVMWVLAARYGGTFDFSTRVVGWCTDLRDAYFCAQIYVERDGSQIAIPFATWFKDKPKWVFGLDFDEPDNFIDYHTFDVDLAVPQDVRRITAGFVKSVGIQLRVIPPAPVP
jgi:hypothetical protein